MQGAKIPALENAMATGPDRWNAERKALVHLPGSASKRIARLLLDGATFETEKAQWVERPNNKYFEDEANSCPGKERDKSKPRVAAMKVKGVHRPKVPSRTY